MPLGADPLGGGTEADGSKSQEYCSYCYRDGRFTDPNLTLDDFKEKLQPMMAEMKIPTETIAKAISMLPHLKRWTHQP